MVSIKKALIADINDLKKICVAAYSLNFHNHWDEGGLDLYLEKEFSEKRLSLDLTDENTEFYFIEHELKTVGFLKIKNNAELDLPSEKIMELEKIYVLTDFKGKGIGSLALKEVINMTEKRDKEYLFLCVLDTNLSSIGFYEKFGFKIHSKTTLEVPLFKEELKGMNIMVKKLAGIKSVEDK